MKVVSVFLLLVIGIWSNEAAFAETPTVDATCRFQNKGKTYVNGPCAVTFFGSNAVELVFGKNRIEILMDDDAATGVAHWNSGHSKKYDYDLGMVTSEGGEDGLCWNGANVKICYEGMDPE